MGTRFHLPSWWRLCAVAVWLTVCAPALGSEVDEARKLKDEAAQILRGASGGATDPKVYAQAVFKLQRAEQLLEQAAKKDPKGVEGLQEEVTASLFWARRFANVNIIRELEKGDPDGKKAAAPVPEPKEKEITTVTGNEPPPERPAKRPEPEAPAEKILSPAQAEALYKKAEAFEKEHTGNDHAVALRWFQVADESTGTDWSLRALSRAREAQERYKAKLAAASKPATEDEKLIAEGRGLFAQKQYPEALAKFEAARKLKKSTEVMRMLGHSHLKMGYAKRDEYAKQYLPMVKKINDAKRNRNRAVMQKVYQENLALLAKLRPLENEILTHYRHARESFESGLSLAKGHDLDCEGHIAILYFEHKKQMLSRQRLATVMKKYEPQNDEERTVFEYCKTLFRRMGGRI